MIEVRDRIQAALPVIREEAVPSDRIGKLTDRCAEALRGTGVVRLLQPKEYDGYEAHPCEFLDAVMTIGAASPSAGWVAGVVGVHPWEIAMMDPRVQEEIWGEDPDTWTASPYAPFGRAKRVDGGYLFTGRWPYSTGTHHSDWVILGGMVVEDDGNPGDPPEIRHFVIPRKDYEIVEDSWYVLGLKGTGSKDVQMTDVFIPEYRTVEQARMHAGGYEDRQPGKPLYRLKFPVFFSSAINAATIGIAIGALQVYREYMDKRVSASGTVAKLDPIQLAVYGEAAADVAAARATLLNEIKELYEYVEGGGEVTMTHRLTARRNCVRAVRRAVDAVDRLYKIAGSQGIHENLPNERYWRDLQAGFSHICNTAEPIYVGWATNDFGGEPPQLFV